jgi:prepilin signal peptidase PulO-like enzyme (type II secretory pathway)
MQADTAILPEPSPSATTPWPAVLAGIFALSAAGATVSMLLRPGSPGLFLPLLCLGVLIVSAAFDAATGRIPNPLTYAAIAVGLLLNCLSVLAQQASPRVASEWLGAAGPGQAAFGFLLFGGIGVVGVIFAGMGGGDMKLLAAIGATLGLARASDALICGAAVAIVYALVNLIIAGRLNATCRVAAGHLLNWVCLREWTLADDKPTPASRRTIPLAIPLLAGMLLAQTPIVAGALRWLTTPG